MTAMWAAVVTILLRVFVVNDIATHQVDKMDAQRPIGNGEGCRRLWK